MKAKFCTKYGRGFGLTIGWLLSQHVINARGDTLSTDVLRETDKTSFHVETFII